MRITIAGVSLCAMAAGVLAWTARTNGQGLAGNIAASCLHDAGESQPNRLRREQALALARAINAAQGQAVQQTKRYQPLAQLSNLPDTPAGFVLRLYQDGDGYLFSLKDDRDVCRYGIFSDRHGTLLQASPTLPLIAS